MKTIKLTKPYIIEGKILEEGTELVIASDGETEVINDTADKPENEVDFGLVEEKEEISTTEEESTNEENKSE